MLPAPPPPNYYPNEWPSWPLFGTPSVLSDGGVYSAQASSQHGIYLAWKAFADEVHGWTSAANYDTAGNYASTAVTSTGQEGLAGEWVQLDLPYPVDPVEIQVLSDNIAQQVPSLATVVVSDDGTSWRLLATLPPMSLGQVLSVPLASVSGEWLQLDLPQGVAARGVRVGRRNANTLEAPRAMVLLGSNTGTEWHFVVRDGERGARGPH